ncbi:CoA transferase [Nocardia sp. NPDC004123]
MNGPLSGLRVVEVSSYVATPLCGMTLAQLGAEVIRVEPIGGAPDRTRWPLAPSGTSLYWAGLNKGKRAIEVDLSTAAGRQVVVDLAAECGVVLANSDRQLTFEDLRAKRADIIHVLLTGRRDGTAAVDYTVNAATGFPSVTGPEDSPDPVNHVLPAWDVAAGLYLAVGLLAAERTRRLEGEGQQVRVALEDVALATAGSLGYLAEAQLGGERRPSGNYVYGTYGRDFTTADGHRVMVVALTPRHWHELVRVTGCGEVMTALAGSLHADFESEADRYRHRRVLSAVLAEWFESNSFADVETALNRTHVLWSRYRSFADLAADDALLLRDSPLMAPVLQPGVGTYLAPGSPVVMGGTQAPPVAAPSVGQHTADVLRAELKLSTQDLEKLAEMGAIPAAARTEGAA